jgi:predicted HicB family RNase H-like nuclease
MIYLLHNREGVYIFRQLLQQRKQVNLMPLTEAQKKANIKYREKSIKRIPLDVQKEKYEEIKAAADAAGEKVNGYIKKAIDERMLREVE